MKGLWLKVTYPGGRVIYYVYETTPTGRLSSISENAGGTLNLVQYTYLGMSTIVKESHPQVAGGLNLSYGAGGTYGGWDRFGRTAAQAWRKDDGTLVDGYTYTYDRAGNRTSKGNLFSSNFSETYAYDGLARLTDTNRGGVDLQNWSLDALGNWDQFTSGTTTQTRDQNAANETTTISGTWVSPTYDAAGNMTSGPKAGAETTRLFYVYDGWNRLVQIKADSAGTPGAVIATYQYDGRGYRTRKTLADGTTYDYYQNDGNQTIEVRKNASVNAYEQYVYDQRYIDAPVMVYRDTNTDATVDQKLYVTQDANFNVTATVNGATGAVVNRFVYTPYGQRTVLTATWTAGTTDFMLGHQGLLLDSESGLYYNRARYLHPTLGNFIQRDPLGYVDGGNVYQYEKSLPTAGADPDGRQMMPPYPPQIIAAGMVGNGATSKKCSDLRCPGDVVIQRHFTNAIGGFGTLARVTKVLSGLVGTVIPGVYALRSMGDIIDSTPNNRAVFYTVVVYGCDSCYDTGRHVSRKVVATETFMCSPSGLPGANHLGGFDSTQPNFFTGTLPACAKQATEQIQGWLRTIYTNPVCAANIKGWKA